MKKIIKDEILYILNNFDGKKVDRDFYKKYLDKKLEDLKELQFQKEKLEKTVQKKILERFPNLGTLLLKEKTEKIAIDILDKKINYRVRKAFSKEMIGVLQEDEKKEFYIEKKDIPVLEKAINLVSISAKKSGIKKEIIFSAFSELMNNKKTKEKIIENLDLKDEESAKNQISKIIEVNYKNKKDFKERLLTAKEDKKTEITDMKHTRIEREKIIEGLGEEMSFIIKNFDENESDFVFFKKYLSKKSLPENELDKRLFISLGEAIKSNPEKSSADLKKRLELLVDIAADLGIEEDELKNVFEKVFNDKGSRGILKKQMGWDDENFYKNLDKLIAEKYKNKKSEKEKKSVSYYKKPEEGEINPLMSGNQLSQSGDAKNEIEDLNPKNPEKSSESSPDTGLDKKTYIEIEPEGYENKPKFYIPEEKKSVSRFMTSSRHKISRVNSGVPRPKSAPNINRIRITDAQQEELINSGDDKSREADKKSGDKKIQKQDKQKLPNDKTQGKRISPAQEQEGTNTSSGLKNLGWKIAASAAGAGGTLALIFQKPPFLS